jgi:LuxR family transcriptional regulator, positive regulator of biofilm formation
MPIDDCQDKHICIIGPLKVQNFALACYLKETLGVECTELTLDNGMMLPEGVQDRNSVLFLIDGTEENLDGKISALENRIRNVIYDFYICLFNIRPDRRVDEEALNQSVQGIFYIDDDIQNLSRGIQAVFNGELWIPRRILTRLIQNHAAEWKVEEVDPDILTPREIEILYLLVTGNDQTVIGNALFISPHTVRTHLSNIFRKIGVKNRLEAKVWFEKNRAALRPETKKVRIRTKKRDGKF